MLADSCESIVRAKRPQTKQEIEEIVNDIFETRLNDGQLDESSITVNDIKALRETFVGALQGMFHPRIVYPPLPTPPTLQTAAVPAGSSQRAIPQMVSRGPQEI